MQEFPVIYNPYIVVPLATWAVAQITKFALAAFRGRLDFRYLYSSGGMPSVHSAVVCSLATTALLVDGLKSHIFGFAVIFAAIVMYDSFGVRRSAGEQAAAINMLIESLDRNRVKLDRPKLHLREILGHQPTEVTVGAVVGIILAGLFNYDRLGWFGVWLQALPQRPELLVYAGIFAGLVVLGIAVRLALRSRYPRSQTIKQFSRRMFTAAWTIGWLGLVSTALAYERASYLMWRLWPLAILATGLAWGVGLGVASYRTVPAGLALEDQTARKQKWLLWGRGRSRHKSK